MINLLPPNVKEEYSYALRNTALLRWLAAFIFALIGLGMLATFGLVTLQHSTTTYSNHITSLQTSLQQEKLAQTQAQVADFTNSLKLVVQVLSKEVLFSQLLKQVATVIPANASLVNLNISQTTGGVDLSAYATDYSTASQVQINLADPNNQIFSKADLVGINCSSTSQNPRYPCIVQIRALFAQKNPFLFINYPKAGS